jgi:hypothetical protein
MAVSGFYPNEVVGNLRPPGQVTQWSVNGKNPGTLRHWESGQYRPSAKLGIRDGFTAQRESGVALDFGEVIVDNSGFFTNTVAVTFNFGEFNSHPNSFFNEASGIATNFKGFNVRLWVHDVTAFTSSGWVPIFYFLSSLNWKKGLQLRPSTPNAQIMPSSLPDNQNILTRATNEVFISGAYKPSEFSRYVYIVGQFPSGNYSLGTYGGLNSNDFTFRWSYDWTDITANVLRTDVDI